MKRNTMLALSTPTILLLSSYTYAADTTAHINDLLNHSTQNEIINAKLGGGFLSNSALPIHMICLSDKIMSQPVYASQITEDISLAQTTSRDDLAKTLNLAADTKVGWGKFSASAAADYINSIKDSAYSLNFSYQSILSAYTEIDPSSAYGQDALNTGAQAAYQQSPDNFIERCGDEYIQGMKMGAVLDVTISMDFKSQQEKQAFDLAFKGGFGSVFSASAKIQSAIEKTHASGTLTIHAFQAGGNPERLSSIFGSTGAHHIIQCSFDNLTACSQALSDVIDYAQASGSQAQTGFAKQVTVSGGKLVADSLYAFDITNATQSSYKRDFGLDIPLKPASKEVIEARSELTDLYNSTDNKYDLAHHILTANAFQHLTGPVQDELKSDSSKLYNNLSMFNSHGAIGCYTASTQDQCSAIVADIKQSLTPVDTTKVDLLQNAFYVVESKQWPLIFAINKDHGDYEIYTTGLVLLKADTFNGINFIYSPDYTSITTKGIYTTLTTSGARETYYMGDYPNQDIVYKLDADDGFAGNDLWDVCLNGVCKPYTINMYVQPF